MCDNRSNDLIIKLKLCLACWIFICYYKRYHVKNLRYNIYFLYISEKYNLLRSKVKRLDRIMNNKCTKDQSEYLIYLRVRNGFFV